MPLGTLRMRVRGTRRSGTLALASECSNRSTRSTSQVPAPCLPGNIKAASDGWLSKMQSADKAVQVSLHSTTRCRRSQCRRGTSYHIIANRTSLEEDNHGNTHPATGN